MCWKVALADTFLAYFGYRLKDAPLLLYPAVDDTDSGLSDVELAEASSHRNVFTLPSRPLDDTCHLEINLMLCVPAAKSRRRRQVATARPEFCPDAYGSGYMWNRWETVTPRWAQLQYRSCNTGQLQREDI